MPPTAADIPSKYDVIINGVGYLFDRTQEARAQHGYSPTFVQRTNVQGDYGDSQQDFWLTWTQRDWSVGEKLKFSRQNDGLSRMFWRGSNIDVRTAGQVTLRSNTQAITFSEAVRASAPYGHPTVGRFVNVAGPTKLWAIGAGGAISDEGAHGLGATPSTFGLTSDGSGDKYVSTTAAGTVGVRKRDIGTGVYSTFSATGADALTYLNNTLYGLRSTSAGVQSLLRYDIAGTATVLHSWKQADGGDGIYAPGANRLDAFGGKLFITWIGMNAEMWVYDGNGVQMVASLPGNFYPHDVDVLFGIPFISGITVRNVTNTTTFEARPAIYYYNGGQIGLMWQADSYITGLSTLGQTLPSVVAFDTGLVFNDESTGRLMYYDITTGGVHAIGSYTTVSSGPPVLAATNSHLLFTNNSTTGYLFPDLSTVATTGYIQGALIDYDSSLTKIFRGVTIEFDEGTGGDGGSIDVAYRLADLDGAYTTLATNVTSGTESVFSNVTGRSISIKVTLNKGTSTTGPVLKRIALRAMPQQPVYRTATYVLALAGRDGAHPTQLNDGTLEPNDGKTLADNLRSAAISSTPITIIDDFGTWTGIIQDGFRLDTMRPHEYRAIVPVREV